MAWILLDYFIIVFSLFACDAFAFNFKGIFPSAAVNSKIPSLKKALLKEISANRKQPMSSGILEAISALETAETSNNYDIRKEDIEGNWALVFSTQISENKDRDDTIVDVISARLYKQVFKLAPFLAGNQETVSTNFQVTNLQNLDIRNGAVNNVVRIKLSKSLGIEINVDGTIRVIKEVNPFTLEVIFDKFSVCLRNSNIGGSDRNSDFTRKLVIPLPRPKGSLVTTFCDGDLRVSRGGRGGIFVAKRVGT